jgi:hypothetical protein
MALVRVAQYGSTPTVVGDYQAQNAHLQAFTNQLLTQQFILDSGTAQPVIKQGTYVSHGGSLYIADADTAITGSPADGSVYIRVSGTTSLTVEFVTDISGYTWNPVYTALTSTTYTLLPYLIVKASTVWTRYNFNPNNQQFGSLASLAVTGNTTVGGTLGVTGAISGASLNTGSRRVEQKGVFIAKSTNSYHTDVDMSANTFFQLLGADMQVDECRIVNGSYSMGKDYIFIISYVERISDTTIRIYGISTNSGGIHALDCVNGSSTISASSCSISW